MQQTVVVERLRALIVASAPEPEGARAVLDCSQEASLDTVIPFSSIIVLGTVVAIEAEFDVRVTAEALGQATATGLSLNSLAQMILRARSGP